MILVKSLNIAIRFLLINIIFFLLTSPFITLYGSFENVRNAAVGVVATWMHHYLLNYFMSEEEINRILANNQDTSADGKILFS